ncbi:MAG: ThuA domain-containing protein [Lachnospiraceae bacterium]|nr:ThuA domain-containing protein [Lachnospiraceae bacterium]MDD3794554.1 ThuA domain-containing protein [Lachnospiraceae bacterium]
MKRKAFIFYGGWDGHEPELVSARFKKMLEEENFEVCREDTLDRLDDEEFLKSMDLIVPCWTQGDLEDRKCFGITEAVMAGTGIAGHHGGMCDSFRWSVEWQFMTGSQWVSHPGNPWLHHVSKLNDENLAYLHQRFPECEKNGAFWTDYEVNFKKNSSSPLIEGLEDFRVNTEQYYLHVDPCIDILATTSVKTEGPHQANGVTKMPVVYTKLWGKGRVFYNSLGHHDDIFDISQVAELQRRGFLWAARKSE